MATARATYRWDDECSVSVSVEAEASYPDSVAEVTVRCRQLLRETTEDLAERIAAIEDDEG